MNVSSNLIKNQLTINLLLKSFIIKIANLNYFQHPNIIVLISKLTVLILMNLLRKWNGINTLKWRRNWKSNMGI